MAKVTPTPQGWQKFLSSLFGIDVTLGFLLILFLGFEHLSTDYRYSSDFSPMLVVTVALILALPLVAVPLYCLWGLWRPGNRWRISLYIISKLLALGFFGLACLFSASGLRSIRLSDISKPAFLFPGWQVLTITCAFAAMVRRPLNTADLK